MNLLLKGIICLFSLFGLIGCTSIPVASPPTVSPTIQSINQSASQIHAELQQLRYIKQQQNQKIFSQANIPDSPSDHILNRKIDFRWTGPIVPAVKKLTKMIDYKFSVTGESPINPPLINLDIKSKSIFHVFEDIGWQAGEKIGVVIDQNKKMVKIFYIGDK